MKNLSYVGNSKTKYRGNGVLILDNTDFAEFERARYVVSQKKANFSDLDVVNYLFKEKYNKQISYTRSMINATLFPLYKRDIPFKTSVLTEVVNKIDQIINETGQNIDVVAQELRSYLGPQTKFFRKENGKKVPCEALRIIKAYKAMKANEVPDKIRTILFNK